MRIVMMGTGNFAVPTFRELIASRHQVLLLVTQPLRGGRRGKPPPPTPIRLLAQEHEIRIFDPEKINTPGARAEIAALEPELFVVADYGQILGGKLLAIPPRGSINVHGSLLPQYRGAAPVQMAIYEGKTKTGVCIIDVAKELDAGAIYASEATAIGPDETTEELEPRLAELGAQLCLKVIDQIEAGTARPREQDDTQATFAPRIEKNFGHIDWRRPAPAIRDQIRALVPWPKSYTHWLRPDSEPLRLIIGRAQVEPAVEAVDPGTVLTADSGILVIACDRGALRIEELQPAGKRMLSSAEFLRGYPVQAGQHFGDPPTETGKLEV